MSSPNLDDLTTVTHRNRTRRITDNMSKNNALFYMLKKKGQVKLKGGGRTLVKELDYQDNQNAMWYSGYQQLDSAAHEVLSAAEYDWKQLAAVLSISGFEKRANSGKEQLIDLYEARIKNAERTCVNWVSTGLYATGASTGGLGIDGLQDVVAIDPTNTVGGIDRTTWDFWKNYELDAYAELGNSVPTAATIQGLMNKVAINCTRYGVGDRIDLVVMDNNYWTLFWDSLQAQQRWTDDKAESGFQSVMFNGAMAAYDGGIGGGAPLNTAYFLCCDYLSLDTHKDMNFDKIGGAEARIQFDIDAEYAIIGWMGNLCASNCQVQGVLHQTTAP